ncbi:hypothetical protein C0Q70_15225 [Pomacea canaliculata]|uniref:Major facilitator superfamily (MFS) profile domain-containing protein n=1 Tax=Pomacea canaliculata TaxID=400727 RepID=A0A2T7NU85_POMCA|nr:hypothetical protein C0Q70_15225 [Pomacea canaliculata]
METSSLDVQDAAAADKDCHNDERAKVKEHAQVVTRPDDATPEVIEMQQKGTGFKVSKKAVAPPKTPVFVFVLTLFAALGGFLLGYDIGIVSGSMLYVQPHFDLDTAWTEAIVSGALGAAAVTALLGGWLADVIGRRYCLLGGSIVFSVGGIVMGVADMKEVLLVGRMVCGMGIGIASVVVPIYVAEASPAHQRGRLTLMWQILINFGVMVSSIIAGSFSYVHENGWRYMLGLSAVPGVVQFIGFLFMPESPRWLVDKGRLDQAREVLARIRGYDDVTEEISDIQKSVEEARKLDLGCQQLVRIWRTKHVRRAVLVGMGLLFFQQWCGINTVIYYSGTVLKMAGFPAKSAVWLVVLPNALLFIAGFIAVFVVDRMGRRPLLIGSMIAVGLEQPRCQHHTRGDDGQRNGNTSLPAGIQHVRQLHQRQRLRLLLQQHDVIRQLPAHGREELSLYGRCNSSTMGEAGLSFAYGYCPSQYNWITVVGMALFVFLFSPGMAPMPWTINAEIYPLWARGTCSSLAAATAWVSNLIISSAFLSLTETITTYGELTVLLYYPDNVCGGRGGRWLLHILNLLDVHWLLCSGAGVFYRVPARDKREEFRTGGGTVHVCQGVEATRHQALMNTLTKRENFRTFVAFIFEVHGGPLLRFTTCLFFLGYPQQLNPDNGSPQHSSRAFQGASVTTQSPQHLREEICDSSVNRFKTACCGTGLTCPRKPTTRAKLPVSPWHHELQEATPAAASPFDVGHSIFGRAKWLHRLLDRRPLPVPRQGLEADALTASQGDRQGVQIGIHQSV